MGAIELASLPMSRFVGKRITCASAVVFTFMLSACSDVSEPINLPPASPSSTTSDNGDAITSSAPTTTQSGTPRVSPLPNASTPDASKDTPQLGDVPRSGAEAEAVVREYFELANNAFLGGDVDGLDRVADKSCPCYSFVTDIADFVREGGTYTGARFDINRIGMADVRSHSAVAELQAIMRPYQRVDKNGKLLEDSPGGAVRIDYFVVKHRGQWLITNGFDLRS
jgi:hypothetical protein